MINHSVTVFFCNYSVFLQKVFEFLIEVLYTICIYGPKGSQKT